MIRPHGLGGHSPAIPRWLAFGLTLSGALLVTGGGWPGVVMGAAQLAVAASLAVRPAEMATLALAAVVLVPAPLLALRLWTSRLPLMCRCAAPTKGAPGLFSLTGVVVALDIGLLVLATGPVLARRRHARARPQTRQ